MAITRAQEQLYVTATRKNEDDWAVVLSEADHKGKPRIRPEDDYFRNLALWASGGAGTLLEPADAESRRWAPAGAAAVADESAELVSETTAREEGSQSPERLQLSFSTMEVFLQCPLRYQYRQEWKIPAPPDGLTPVSGDQAESPPVSPAQLGTLIHATLEAFHEPGPLDGKGGLERLRQIWDSVCNGELDPEHFRDLWARRVRAMFERYLESEVSAWPTLATEQEFNLAYDGAMIRGFIDRVALPPHGPRTVVDYKTGAVAAEAGYGMQLQIYADATSTQTNDGDAILFGFKQGSVIRPDEGQPPTAVIGQILNPTRSVPANPPCSSCAYNRCCPRSRVSV